MSPITVTKHGRTRFWAVHDGDGELICVCVYKRGAIEVARRLSIEVASSDCYLRESPSEPARGPVRALSGAACQGEYRPGHPRIAPWNPLDIHPEPPERGSCSAR